MRKLVFAALMVGLVACGGGGGKTKTIHPLDGPSGSDSGNVCNVLTQMGCMTGQKCTWIVDASTPNPLGHVGCAPDGTKTTSCTRNAPGAMGWDDCMHGYYCFGPDAGGAGTCKVICDPAGGNPMCPANFACTTYDSLFGASGQPDVAGVCDPSCDPLADNNFLGSQGNNQSGTTCGSAGSNGLTGLGCYGFPDGRNGVTHWTCTGQLNPSRVHRAACDTTMHAGDGAQCSPAANSVYINGCAAGYEPVFSDAEGSSQIDCMALCAPANCYNAGSGAISNPNCGTLSANLPGNPAAANGKGSGGTQVHQCTINPQDIQVAPGVTFKQAQPGATPVDGEECFYSWQFEFDASNNFVKSPTSDTVGFCVDHTKYRFDPTGGSNANTQWPECDKIGLGSGGYMVLNSGTQNQIDASSFGCVDYQHAGLTFKDGQPRHSNVVDFRLPYHMTAGKPF